MCKVEEELAPLHVSWNVGECLLNWRPWLHCKHISVCVWWRCPWMGCCWFGAKPINLEGTRTRAGLPSLCLLLLLLALTTKQSNRLQQCCTSSSHIPSFWITFFSRLLNIYKYDLKNIFHINTRVCCIATYLLTSLQPAHFSCMGLHSCVLLKVLRIKGHVHI